MDFFLLANIVYVNKKINKFKITFLTFRFNVVLKLFDKIKRNYVETCVVVCKETDFIDDIPK